jgi:hypothetical protein
MAGEGQMGRNSALLLAVGSNAGGLKMATGVHTTVAASDTVPTGLTTVVSVIAQLGSDPVDGAMHVTAALSATAGAIDIKGWKSTDGDATLIAATTFSKSVHWVAYGY